jgi:hypothetical protein
VTRRSFTLLDLSLAAVLVAALACVVIPYVERASAQAKAQEAIELLRDLHGSAAAYYDARHEGRERCALGRSAVLPEVPGPSPKWADFDRDPVFHALGYGAGESLYALHVAGRSGCDIAERGDTVYTFRAFGDLDGDGVQSRFELRSTRGLRGLERSALHAHLPLE